MQKYNSFTKFNIFSIIMKSLSVFLRYENKAHLQSYCLGAEAQLGNILNKLTFLLKIRFKINKFSKNFI